MEILDSLKSESSFHYSDDFETTSTSLPVDLDLQAYSEDFETYSESHNVRPSSRRSKTPLDTASSVVILSLDEYSESDTTVLESSHSNVRPAYQHSLSLDLVTESLSSYDDRYTGYTSSVSSVDLVSSPSPRKVHEPDDHEDSHSSADVSTTAVTESEITVTEYEPVDKESQEALRRFVNIKWQQLHDPQKSSQAIPALVHSKHKGRKSQSAKALSSFIDKKLHSIHRNKMLPQKEAASMKAQPCWKPNDPAKDTVEKHGISSATVNQLKMANFMTQAKQVATSFIHEPKKCKSCRKKLGQLQEQNFLRTKCTIVTEKAMQDKLERYLTECRDPTLLMGKCIADFPQVGNSDIDVLQIIGERAGQPKDNTNSGYSALPDQLQQHCQNQDLAKDCVIRDMQDSVTRNNKLSSKQVWEELLRPLQGTYLDSTNIGFGNRPCQSEPT